MLFHSFYLAIVRMHTKEKMICSFSCHSTSLMSLSTLVEIYTLLCHEAEGELIYDSRNFICIYTSQTLTRLSHISTIVEIIYAFTPVSAPVSEARQSTIVEIIYAFTPSLSSTAILRTSTIGIVV